MKKRIILFCVTVILTLLLTGCSPERQLEFDVFYYEAMGYNESEDQNEPLRRDALLLMNQEDYEKFTDEFFSRSQIPPESPADDKAAVVLFLPSETNSVSLYYVKNVSVLENTISVTIKKTLSKTLVPRMSGDGSIYQWVLFIQTDKAPLREDMEIEVTVI